MALAESRKRKVASVLKVVSRRLKSSKSSKAAPIASAKEVAESAPTDSVAAPTGAKAVQSETSAPDGD